MPEPDRTNPVPERPAVHGGGAMGDAIRAKDWSETPVGPAHGWPPALRNALNLVLNSQESMFVMWGPGLTFFFNDAYRPMLGPRLPTALGANISEVWADTWDQVLPVVEQALAGTGTRFEQVPLTMARYGAPERTWWTFSFSPLYDDAGAIGGMLGITREVTAEVLAAQGVRADKAALTQMFEQAPGFMAMLRGPEHRFTLANASYVKLIGHRPLMGRTVAEALPDAAEQGYVALLDEVYRTGTAFSATGATYAVQAVPGGPVDERHIDFVMQPVVDAEGRVGRIFVEGYDVTERIAAEAGLRRLAETLEAEVQARTVELARSEAHWRGIFERLHEGFVFGELVHDADGAAVDWRYLEMNPAWETLTGLHRADVVGRRVSEVIPGLEAGWIADAIQVVATGEPLTVTRQVAAWGRWYRVHVFRPEPERFACVFFEVTEQLQAEEALRQSQKMEAVGQLTGGVAHDFNNLLTIIRSSVDFLRRPDLPEERRRRYMDSVSDTVERAAKLTGQLLAFARRQTLKPETFDVGTRLRSVADMLDTVTGARIRVVADLPGASCFIRADASQFETALINMAVNARDAMAGEGALTLRLEGAASMPPIRGHAGGQGSFAAVSITDTGSGIAPDDLARIFEPFFTTKEVGKGTGLGLSQVIGFAKQSGGDIAVASAPGRGTTFTLYLPEVDAQVEAEPGTEDPDDAPSEGGGLCVLVVEDNIEVGRFATQILDDLGYGTVWAHNAEDALAEMEKVPFRFDAVFSDVVMPGMGGIALARKLQALHPGLPVVLTSGYSHVLAQDDAHGFDLVRKPYSAEQISRVLRAATARKRPRRRMHRLGS